MVTLRDKQNAMYIDGRYYETGHTWSYVISYTHSFMGWHDGIIDNLRIYNRILTREEIKELYQAKQ